MGRQAEPAIGFARHAAYVSVADGAVAETGLLFAQSGIGRARASQSNRPRWRNRRGKAVVCQRSLNYWFWASQTVRGVGRKFPEVGLVLCPMPRRSVVPGAGC